MPLSDVVERYAMYLSPGVEELYERKVFDGEDIARALKKCQGQYSFFATKLNHIRVYLEGVEGEYYFQISLPEEYYCDVDRWRMLVIFQKGREYSKWRADPFLSPDDTALAEELEDHWLSSRKLGSWKLLRPNHYL